MHKNSQKILKNKRTMSRNCCIRNQHGIESSSNYNGVITQKSMGQKRKSACNKSDISMGKMRMFTFM